VLGLSTAIGGSTYGLLGGTIGQVARLSNLLPALVAAACIEGINAILVTRAISLQVHKPAFEVWKQSMSWATPIAILGAAVGGGGLAIGYTIASFLGVIVFFLPILLTIYSFNLYVSQTKAQMDRLEEIIASHTADLSRVNEELKRMDLAKTRFYAVINHEMRSPLTAIIGYTALLCSSDLSTDDRDMLDCVRRSGERLLDLVNSILDIARIDDGRMTLVRGNVPIEVAIRQTLDVIEPMAREKKDPDPGGGDARYSPGPWRSQAHGADLDQPVEQRRQVHAGHRPDPGCRAQEPGWGHGRG
jgi:signal transduction histidine kinase